MTVPPGASALAKSGASSISGPARMLAMIRSNGARAASSGESIPSATASSNSPAPWPSVTPLIAALSRETSIATGSMSVAMHRAPWPKAKRRECEQTGARADVGNVCELATVAGENIQLLEAAGGGRVLAGAEARPASDLERGGSGRDAAAVGRGVDEEAAGADRLEPGLAHRHPVRLAERLDARSPLPSRATSARSSAVGS